MARFDRSVLFAELISLYATSSSNNAGIGEERSLGEEEEEEEEGASRRSANEFL